MSVQTVLAEHRRRDQETGKEQRDTQREDCITQIDKQNPQERIVLKIQTSGLFIHIQQVNNFIFSLNIEIFKLSFCEIMFILTFW